MYYQDETRGSSSMRVVFTYGTIRTSSEFVQMGYLEDVYQLKKESKSLKDAIHHLMEDIMEHSVHIQRSGRADFSSQPCMKTPRNSFGDAEHVKNMATSIPQMPCH
jgi:hypothetical protein